MTEKLTFQTHPLKTDIIKRWDDGQNPTDVHEWLKKEHPNVVLSHPTLCKHFSRYKFNKKHADSADKEAIEAEKKKKKAIPIETILWETIQQCRKKKKDSTISVKDWQYLDQQLQSAIEKLIRIQDTSGESRDISNILSEIFAKFELGATVDLKDVKKPEISESDKAKIAQEVDDEAKVESGIPSKTD